MKYIYIYAYIHISNWLARFCPSRSLDGMLIIGYRIEHRLPWVKMLLRVANFQSYFPRGRRCYAEEIHQNVSSSPSQHYWWKMCVISCKIKVPGEKKNSRIFVTTKCWTSLSSSLSQSLDFFWAYCICSGIFSKASCLSGCAFCEAEWPPVSSGIVCMTWNRLLELACPPDQKMQAEINYDVFETKYLPEIGKRCTARNNQVREIPGRASCCLGVAVHSRVSIAAKFRRKRGGAFSFPATDVIWCAEKEWVPDIISQYHDASNWQFNA